MNEVRLRFIPARLVRYENGIPSNQQLPAFNQTSVDIKELMQFKTSNCQMVDLEGVTILVSVSSNHKFDLLTFLHGKRIAANNEDLTIAGMMLLSQMIQLITTNFAKPYTNYYQHPSKTPEPIPYQGSTPNRDCFPSDLQYRKPVDAIHSFMQSVLSIENECATWVAVYGNGTKLTPYFKFISQDPTYLDQLIKEPTGTVIRMGSLYVKVINVENTWTATTSYRHERTNTSGSLSVSGLTKESAILNLFNKLTVEHEIELTYADPAYYATHICKISTAPAAPKAEVTQPSTGTSTGFKFVTEIGEEFELFGKTITVVESTEINAFIAWKVVTPQYEFKMSGNTIDMMERTIHKIFADLDNVEYPIKSVNMTDLLQRKYNNVNLQLTFIKDAPILDAE